MPLLRSSRGPRSSRAGLSIVEITIAIAIVTTILSASAGAFLGNLSAVRQAEALSSGTLFLETVMENLSAQPYEELLGFDGDLVHDGQSLQRSRYGVTLAVFEAEVGLLQIGATLSDLRNDREIGRITTLRSSR